MLIMIILAMFVILMQDVEDAVCLNVRSLVEDAGARRLSN